MSVSVEVKGLDRAKKRFRGMQQRAKSPKTVMAGIGARAWKDVIDSFKIQQNEDGAKWSPLKKSTVAGRRKKSNVPLQDTGRLRNSVRYKNAATWTKVFTPVKYAVYHQKGKGRMRREFMWVNDKLRLQFAKMLLDYIKG